MSALDFCERGTFDVLTTHGQRVFTGWRYHDFAIHAPICGPGEWTLTHLPSGMSLGSQMCRFSAVEDAAEAMVEIAALRNDWTTIPDGDRPALRDRIREIGARHSGVSYVPEGRVIAQARAMRGSERWDMNRREIAS